jgi:mono/diheme cytochrome c family protein
MLKPIAIAALIFAAAAAPPPAARLAAGAKRGLAFAQLRCAGCHAVTANAISPNPESPSFEHIANRPGVTRLTLRQFLRDSHNYPDAMNFTVGPSRSRDLADYVLTMRKPGYRPVM